MPCNPRSSPQLQALTGMVSDIEKTEKDENQKEILFNLPRFFFVQFPSETFGIRAIPTRATRTRCAKCVLSVC